MNDIVIYVCRVHGLMTSRGGMRKHLGEHHARNKFKSLKMNDKFEGVWYTKKFGEEPQLEGGEIK